MKSDESEDNSEFGSGTMGDRCGEAIQIPGSGACERRVAISIAIYILQFCKRYLIRLYFNLHFSVNIFKSEIKLLPFIS